MLSFGICSEMVLFFIWKGASILRERLYPEYEEEGCKREGIKRRKRTIGDYQAPPGLAEVTAAKRAKEAKKAEYPSRCSPVLGQGIRLSAVAQAKEAFHSTGISSRSRTGYLYHWLNSASYPAP